MIHSCPRLYQTAFPALNLFGYGFMPLLRIARIVLLRISGDTRSTMSGLRIERLFQSPGAIE